MSPFKPVTITRPRWMIVSTVTVALMLPAAAWWAGASISGTQDVTSDNCLRIHQLVNTLDTLIASGRAQAVAYERDGTITHRQLVRALRENDKSRAKLGEADCPPRSVPPS